MLNNIHNVSKYVKIMRVIADFDMKSNRPQILKAPKVNIYQFLSASIRNACQVMNVLSKIVLPF